MEAPEHVEAKSATVEESAPGKIFSDKRVQLGEQSLNRQAGLADKGLRR